MQIGANHNAGIASSRGFQTYAQEAVKERLTERLSGRLADQQHGSQSDPSAQQGESRTRSVGFSLGKFGVRYETEDTAGNASGAGDVLSPETIARASAQAESGSADSLTLQALRNQTAVEMAAAGDVSPRMMREGANAYAQTEARYHQLQAPAMFTGSV